MIGIVCAILTLGLGESDAVADAWRRHDRTFVETYTYYGFDTWGGKLFSVSIAEAPHREERGLIGSDEKVAIWRCEASHSSGEVINLIVPSIPQGKSPLWLEKGRNLTVFARPSKDGTLPLRAILDDRQPASMQATEQDHLLLFACPPCESPLTDQNGSIIMQHSLLKAMEKADPIHRLDCLSQLSRIVYSPSGGSGVYNPRTDPQVVQPMMRCYTTFGTEGEQVILKTVFESIYSTYQALVEASKLPGSWNQGYSEMLATLWPDDGPQGTKIPPFIPKQPTGRVLNDVLAASDDASAAELLQFAQDPPSQSERMTALKILESKSDRVVDALMPALSRWHKQPDKAPTSGEDRESLITYWSAFLKRGS